MIEKKRSLPHVVGVVSGGHFFSHLYLLAYPPLFPLLQDVFSLSTAQLGLIVSAAYAPQLFLQIPLGAAVDIVGAKRVFVIGILVTAGGTILAGLAGSYAMLLAAVGLSGIGQSAFHPADFALLDAVTDDRNEGKSFSIHTFSGYAGFAVAPVLVGGIGLAAGWSIAILVIGAAGITYGAFAHLIMGSVHLERIDDSDTRFELGVSTRDAVAALVRPRMLAVFLVYFVSMIAIVGVQSFTPIFVVDGLEFGESVGNTALTANLVLTAAGILLGGVLADRFRFQYVLAVMLGAAAAITWLMVFRSLHVEPIVTIGLLAGIGLATGAALPSRDKFTNLFSTADDTGKSFGFAYTGLSLGGIIGPAVLGATIDTMTVMTAFAVIGACFLGAAVVGILVGTTVGGASPTGYEEPS